MKLEQDGDNYVMRFDNFTDFVKHNEKEDFRSEDMNDRDFYGVESMGEAIRLAKTGLPRAGIDALDIAQRNVEEVDRDLMVPRFHSLYAVDGADVDVARYLSGEPENMIGYYLDEAPGIRRVATLVVNITYAWSVDSKKITDRGRAIMSLMEAIERTGMQTEIWADNTMSDQSTGSEGIPEPGSSVMRTSIRVKAAGEIFDPSTFMYVFTHPSMFRALGFNTMHTYPKHLHKQFSVPGHYGYAVIKPYRIEQDYPEGAIYIPSIRHNDDPKSVFRDSLKKLGLLEGTST